MWWMMAAQAGMSILGGAAQYSAQKAQAKAEKKWQKYRNTMLAISNAQTQNAITTNTVMAQADNALNRLEIEKNEIVQRGDAVVQAAAAGVGGGSVSKSVQDVARNAAQMQAERMRQYENTLLGLDYERRNANQQTAMSKDTSYIPKPSATSTLLGIGKDIAGIGIDNRDYLSDLWS